MHSPAWEPAQGALSARSKPAPSTGRSRNDTSIKALTAFVLLGAQLASMLPVPAGAVDGDPFPGSIAPNVVIILDISGSMADHTPANAYVPTKRYAVQNRCESSPRKGRTATAQPCSTGAIFKGSTHARYADSVSRVTGNGAAAARTALAESGYWSGSIQGVSLTLQTGNYINYLVGSCASGGACPESKMATAKRAISSVLDTVRGVRFGIMTFHYGSHGVRGARVVAPVGSGVPAIKSAVSALAPARDAPLGDALYDAGQYFKGEPLTNGTSFPSPIQLGCQANHVILITDGIQSSGARSMTAEATLRKEQDHAASLADAQQVMVHTIGFGVTINTSPSTSDRALTDLKHAAENGGGTAAHAETATDLEASLRLVLTRITEATYSFTNPVLPTVTTTGSRRAYLASFEPAASAPFWRGSLKAYQRASNGVVPVDDNGLPLASALIWDAGRMLNGLSAGSRTIYTEIGGRLTPFTKANSGITRAMLGVSSAADRDRVIDFVRGVDINDENRARGTTDDRPWKLGAIVHSTPVLVTAPVLALNDTSYQMFKAAQAKRTKVLIVGADDGMLHAFREKDGVEIWAFIPPDMLERLRALSAADGAHATFVDGSPIAVDIKTAGTWKTIVVFGCRRGGPFYYALDITDTTNPKFLWRFTDPKIQETWSEPAIGKVKVGAGERYVAFVGGGRSPSDDNTYGKAFFAVDLASGTRLWEYAGGAGATDDRQYMNFGIAASPSAVDADNDGYVDHVYVGDVGGQLWKFDVSATDTSNWKGRRFFAADPAQPNPPPAGDYAPTQGISAAPALALDPQRNIWLFFGTGDPSRADAMPVGRFYGLKDDTDMTNGAALTAASPGIKDVTAANVTASQGWYVVLAGRGEKPVGAANVFNGTVFFSTFTPDRTGGCGGGSTKLYALHASRGYAAVDFATGASAATPTASTPRFKEVGRGLGSMPVIVLAPPIAPGAPPTASLITATSNQELRSTPIPAPSFLKQVKSWRERGQ
jgi:type IV pilus assembly protein PilY1